jgi:hypothetical protein
MQAWLKSSTWFNAHLQNVERLEVRENYVFAQTRSGSYEAQTHFDGFWVEVHATEGTWLRFGDNMTAVRGKFQVIYRGDCLYCEGPGIEVWADDLLFCVSGQEDAEC